TPHDPPRGRVAAHPRADERRLVHRRVGDLRRHPAVPGHGVCASRRYEPAARVVAAASRIRAGSNRSARPAPATRRCGAQQAAGRISDVEARSMTSTVERRKRRIGWSARAFKDLVWPSFACEFPGELMPMESVADSHFAKILDMRAGIDAWLLLPKSGPVRGIASRVQPAPPSRPWNTFTVR